MGYIGNQTSNSYSSFDKQTITGNGGASYTLDHAVANVNEIEVFVNNVRQEPAVAYTVSGTALTMTGNVASTDDFYVVFQGKALQTTVPPDGSVTSAKMDTNIDIAGTLDATGIITADAGIKLGGTASANLLDDYEEGTWTPTDASGASLTLTTSGTQNYVKIGSLVFVNCYVTYPTTSNTSQALIGGLPFTSKAYHQITLRVQSQSAKNLVFQTTAGTKQGALHADNGTLQNSTITGDYVLFNGCYFTDD